MPVCVCVCERTSGWVTPLYYSCLASGKRRQWSLSFQSTPTTETCTAIDTHCLLCSTVCNVFKNMINMPWVDSGPTQFANTAIPSEQKAWEIMQNSNYFGYLKTKKHCSSEEGCSVYQ